MIPDQLLTFWFGRTESGWSNDQHRRRWFYPDPSFDADLTARFGHWLPQLREPAHVNSATGARDNLAFIIACDQLPRNIHRGLAAAFAWDELAFDLAGHGIEAGLDRELTIDERSFFYMPYMHSESLCNQLTAVRLFTQLRDDTPAGFRHYSGAFLRSAMQHRDIIHRFGRFPHRNAASSRTSTIDELAWLSATSGG